jgi:hypothetical protein
MLPNIALASVREDDPISHGRHSLFSEADLPPQATADSGATPRYARRKKKDQV